MKKTLSIILSFVIVLSGFGITSINIGATDESNIEEIKYTWIKNSDIKITDDSSYSIITFIEESSFFMIPGKPLLPKIVKTFEIPFGAKNIKVNLQTEISKQIQLDKKIIPSPIPKSLSVNDENQPIIKIDSSIYQSNDPYPLDRFSYNTGCGLNKNGDHVTYVTVYIYPIQYIPNKNLILPIEKADISIEYLPPSNDIFPSSTSYDLVIISPSVFQSAIEPLIQHKIDFGIETVLKTTEEIYNEYDGVDKPEKIKYFIKDAIETWNIKYVLLLGGLKSKVYAKSRDNDNSGEKGWHIPVRFSNLYFGDPGYISDLYYADIYKTGGEFDNWDSNGNGIFAEWNDDTQIKDIIDLYPDVSLGRLACRNSKEVTDVVNKIIKYETTSSGSDWFKRMLVVSGDGFLDQHDLNIQWDTNEIPDGDYSIHAQSFNPSDEAGYIDTINIIKDSNVESVITFNHDDHLNPGLANGYPAPPIAEIVSISEGNILGNTDVESTPYAYCNDLFWWANISFINGILTIRGKSYDPKPYGNITNIHVWITNENEDIIFSEWRNNTKTYYEGEWVTGDEAVLGRGGALYYMPEDFEKVISWTSNGEYTNQQDVIDIFSEGYGFAFFSGHGSPGFWGDHTPGIPGDRANSQLTGLVVSQLSVRPFFPFVFFESPLYPMEELTNYEKLPITVVGGCYNAQFTVSMIPTMLEYVLYFMGIRNHMNTFGDVVPECWCWYMVKMPETGSIATIGNTGTGWGWEGEFCTIGAGDGWISSEFFKQYGENSYEILGDNFLQTQTEYINEFREFTLPECWWYPDLGWDIIDEKTVQQWVLLGDPTLRIGGY